MVYCTVHFMETRVQFDILGRIFIADTYTVPPFNNGLSSGGQLNDPHFTIVLKLRCSSTLTAWCSVCCRTFLNVLKQLCSPVIIVYWYDEPVYTCIYINISFLKDFIKFQNVRPKTWRLWNSRGIFFHKNVLFDDTL